MKAVVSGSSGFIGSHLVDALLARGAEVRVLVRPETPVIPRDRRISLWPLDLCDPRVVSESTVWDDATHVFHVAGCTRARSEAQFRGGNVEPTVNVLTALTARGGVFAPRLVYVSSQAAAGPAPSAERPVRESDPPMPFESYGRSKREAEQAIEEARESIRSTIVRPAAVYGPRDRDFLQAFRQATSRVALHAAPSDHSFSIVHVGDLVAALLLCAEHPDAIGQTYFVANAEPVTWAALYAAIAHAAGVEPVSLQVPMGALALAAAAADMLGSVTGRAPLLSRSKIDLARPRWWLCDSSRVREELGWSPSVTLEQGIRDTLEWYVTAQWMRRPRSGRAAGRGTVVA